MRPVIAALVALLALPASAQVTDDLLTVAEQSGFTATSTSDQVLALAERLAEGSERITLLELGRSHEDRVIPLLLIADPPIEDLKALADTDRLVVLLIGNIHAGEVCGKEALLMLAREFAAAQEPGALEHVAVALVPNYNPDGNDRFAPDNRPNQNGPAGGVGQRANALGLDLNRDYVKLEAPETRALLAFINQIDPAVIVDTHTTNGSYHRFVLTYDANKHPAGDRRLTEFVRGTMLPAITDSLRANYDRDTFWYGTMDRRKTRWSTYPADPRFGTPYRGLRNRVAILSEAYAYAPYEDRIGATLDFCRAVVEYSGANAELINDTISAADKRTVELGRSARADNLVPIDVEIASAPRRITIPGFVEDADGAPTDEHAEYLVEHFDRFRAADSVRRPWAYLIDADQSAAIANLLLHGVEVRLLREDIELNVESYHVESRSRADHAFQGHFLAEFDVRPRSNKRMIEAGAYLIRTDQPLGTLACVLLEPESRDGLATWNIIDAQQGGRYPVARLLERSALLTSDVPGPPSTTADRITLTFDNLYEADDPPSIRGSAARIAGWLDDETFLQVKNRELFRVDADTGRATPFVRRKRLERALAQLPAIDKKTAGKLAKKTRFNWTKNRRRAVLEHADDLYFVHLDGSRAVRLTATPEREELARPSPDESHVAYIRDNDLWVVDTKTQTERALTTGGHDTLRSGKASWVYFEEIFGRNWRTFWWSPDSRRIAFIETDSERVPEYTIVDNRARKQKIEVTRYPKPGQANPIVRVGIVAAGGGPINWVDLDDYDPGQFLITRVQWLPGSGRLLVVVQNRTQTWADLLLAKTDGSVTRLFRETTGAWVEGIDDPHFFDDGSFLVLSERDGWKHLYHYDAEGQLIKQVTSGEWEARTLHAVNEKKGFAFVSGTRDSHIAQNLYRVDIESGEITLLTDPALSHRLSVSPNGNRFVSIYSDYNSPERTAIFDADGSLIRVLDTNPVPDLARINRGTQEFFTITTDDGFELECYTILPPDFDPMRRYPLMFLTYGGPHAPTVAGSWRTGRTFEHMLAAEGFIVFRTDPRSASGKGAQSAWTSYKRFGKAEVDDMVFALEYMAERPYVDRDRIGMTGHSFGGTSTLSMMINTDLIAAGIASAPVTDWREYDTIYTERYMSTPQDNPEGYAETSMIEHAEDLSGRLMLVYGLIDDNVHAQNSVRFIQALHDAEISFDLMVYPANRHGIGGEAYTARRLEFLRSHLRPGQVLPATEPSESAQEHDAPEDGVGIDDAGAPN